MNINFDIKKELVNIIHKTSNLRTTYLVSHPNSKYSLDLIINEIFYVLQTGISWRKLRSPINYKTLYWHFNNFVKHNVFFKLFNKLKSIYLRKYIVSNKNPCLDLLLDTTIIYNKFGITKLGRNKFYKNKKCTKLSLLTDINGIPLSIFLIKGNYHDNSIINKHVKDIKLLFPKNKCRLIADKGYPSKKIYELLETNNIDHLIPPTKNMKIYNTYHYSKQDYKKRIKIENIFARIKMMHRLEFRFDKLLASYKGFLYLGISIIFANILNML